MSSSEKTPPGNSSLPPEKVFPIQIGGELFRLSGASISSDAPSYFSQFFEQQLQQNDGGSVKTLYIDRDPVTFRDISKHLQGYHVRPQDGSHYVKLFADAQFYSLPRLISQLYECEICIQIGERHFQIPRDIFSGPGDSPNFFTLGFAVFFASPGDVFPGVDRSSLLRPPAIIPPTVSNRSGETFAELLHLLRGYPVNIRNEYHRTELLRDCRYYHLRGLEQRLIPHQISHNLQRQNTEIALRLEDIRPSGIQLVGGWVHYARPFIDDEPMELVVETGNECLALNLASMRVDPHGAAGCQMSKLAQAVASKTTTPMNPDRVRVRFERDSDVVLDGKVYDAGTLSSSSAQTPGSAPPQKRRREEEEEEEGEGDRGKSATHWTICNGQWRLQVVPAKDQVEIFLVAVKVEAMTNQKIRNYKRVFLGS